MKKILFIVLLIVISFTKVDAYCNDSELNEWATKVKSKFVNSVDINAQELDYAYFLTIEPLRDDIKIKVTDKFGASAYGQTYEYSYDKIEKVDGEDEVKKVTEKIYGVGCYNNLEEETYKIEVYGGDNSSCKNELLKTLTYTVPRYNRMAKREICETYPEHELCKTYTNKTKNMTEQEFNKVLDEYDKEQKDKFKKDLTLIEKLLIYALYVIIPFVIVTVIYMIKIKNYKKTREV